MVKYSIKEFQNVPGLGGILVSRIGGDEPVAVGTFSISNLGSSLSSIEVTTDLNKDTITSLDLRVLTHIRDNLGGYLTLLEDFDTMELFRE